MAGAAGVTGATTERPPLRPLSPPLLLASCAQLSEALAAWARARVRVGVRVRVRVMVSP